MVSVFPANTQPDADDPVYNLTSSGPTAEVLPATTATVRTFTAASAGDVNLMPYSIDEEPLL